MKREKNLIFCKQKANFGRNVKGSRNRFIRMECIDHDDELDLSSLVDKTRNINVPIGHIIAAQRWKNSELHHTLQSK